MTKQWIRFCEFTIEAESGGGGFKFAYAGNPGREGLRIEFRIWRDDRQMPNRCDLTVTNPMRETAQALASEDQTAKRMILKVGYESGGMKGIFSGDIIQCRYGRTSPTDTHLIVNGRDNGRAYDYAYMNKTLPKDSTGQDVYDEALKSMQEYKVQKGDVSKALKDKKYDYPVVLSGQTKDILRSLGRQTETLWSLQNGKLDMLKPQEPGQGEAIVINAKTGMIGMPEQLAKYIIVRVLINPAIEVNKVIKLDNNSILLHGWDLSIGGASPGSGPVGGINMWIPPLSQDGLYKCFKIEYVGDTRGNPWYMDLYCTALGSPIGPPPGDVPFPVFGESNYTLTPVGSG